MKKKTLLLMATLMGTVALGVGQITADVVTKVFDWNGKEVIQQVTPPRLPSWNLTWTVTGGVVGNFDVGIRNPLGGVIIAATNAPVGANCNEPWYFTLPVTGTIYSYGDFCKTDMADGKWDMVLSPHNAQSWVKMNTFSLHEIDPSCCDACGAISCPSCTGTYHAGILSLCAGLEPTSKDTQH